MAKQVHPIGKRFQRLSATIDGSKRSQLRVHFVVADPKHSMMCWYVWQQGQSAPSPTDKFQKLVDQAEVDADVYAIVAASTIKNEVIGQEGGSIKPRDVDDSLEIDNFATGGANLGISGKDKGFFTVHVYALSTPGISHFDLSFQGDAPSDLVGHVQSGLIFRISGKTRFSHVMIKTGRL